MKHPNALLPLFLALVAGFSQTLDGTALGRPGSRYAKRGRRANEMNTFMSLAASYAAGGMRAVVAAMD